MTNQGEIIAEFCYACGHGRDEKIIQMVNSGCDVNQEFIICNKKAYPIQFPMSYTFNIIKFLCEHGVDLNLSVHNDPWFVSSILMKMVIWTDDIDMMEYILQQVINNINYRHMINLKCQGIQADKIKMTTYRHILNESTKKIVRFIPLKYYSKNTLIVLILIISLL